MGRSERNWDRETVIRIDYMKKNYFLQKKTFYLDSTSRTSDVFCFILFFWVLAIVEGRRRGV